MQFLNAVDEDWELLRSFFPAQWRELARQTGALKGLRQDKDEENFLRVLLLHLGCGFSLHETVARARLANLANLSDVALLKMLRKSKDWLAGQPRVSLQQTVETWNEIASDPAETPRTRKTQENKPAATS